MSYFRIIKPIEVNFLRWINHAPDSFHPSDVGRFYDFADAALRYKKTQGKKWFVKSFFYDNCKKYKPSLDEWMIDDYWSRFEHICEYREIRRLHHISSKLYALGDAFSYYLQTVEDGKIVTIPIDKDIYLKPYISKSLLQELIKKPGVIKK